MKDKPSYDYVLLRGDYYQLMRIYRFLSDGFSDYCIPCDIFKSETEKDVHELYTNKADVDRIGNDKLLHYITYTCEDGKYPVGKVFLGDTGYPLGCRPILRAELPDDFDMTNLEENIKPYFKYLDLLCGMTIKLCEYAYFDAFMLTSSFCNYLVHFNEASRLLQVSYKVDF